jgi:hypothetical protein
MWMEFSLDRFVSLLEYAEEVLKCTHIIVCFKKDRNDRGACQFFGNWKYCGRAVHLDNQQYPCKSE